MSEDDAEEDDSLRLVLSHHMILSQALSVYKARVSTSNIQWNESMWLTLIATEQWYILYRFNLYVPKVFGISK